MLRRQPADADADLPAGRRATRALTRILVGMHDYYTGLDPESFQRDGRLRRSTASAAGENLAGAVQADDAGVWELPLARARSARLDAAG